MLSVIMSALMRQCNAAGGDQLRHRDGWPYAARETNGAEEQQRKGRYGEFDANGERECSEGGRGVSTRVLASRISFLIVVSAC
jgi:hypothetical protein